MATELTFDPVRLPPECVALRKEVRAFLAEETAAGTLNANIGGGIDGAFSAEFSRKVGAKGWIGMTWPKKYGGHERTFLERSSSPRNSASPTHLCGCTSSPTARADPSSSGTAATA